MEPPSDRLPLATSDSLQSAVDWNKIALNAITTGLDEIPEIGSVLSLLVETFWPESKEDVWGEIRDQVQALINQAISNDVYHRVQAQLGSADQGSGMVGVLQNYLGSISTENNNGQDPKTTWTSANVTFIGALGAFQQQDYEVLLLQLFAQFANMHLSLLRDGVTRGWCNGSELTGRIKSYNSWVDTWLAKGRASRVSANKGFQYVNLYDRQMQLGVGNFRETWPYFDLTQYPPPVKNMVFWDEIYYSITEAVGRNSNASYQLPVTPQGTIANIDVWWRNDNYGHRNSVQGTQLTYTPQGITPYAGVLVNGKQPSVTTNCNAANGEVCYFVHPVALTPDNPVMSVHGAYEITGGTYSVEFWLKGGYRTGQIPPQQNQDQYTHRYDITPPDGYHLSSIWVPAPWSFYNMASDMVFGFRRDPVSVDQETARALYVSSLSGSLADNPKIAAFAAAAAKENWEAQRQAFLKRLSAKRQA